MEDIEQAHRIHETLAGQAVEEALNIEGQPAAGGENAEPKGPVLDETLGPQSAIDRLMWRDTSLEG
jgi:hypothetical protein